MKTLPRHFLAILLAGLIVLAGVISFANRRHVMAPQNAHRAVNDFNRWMQPTNGTMRGSIAAFLHEGADYTNDDFPNPPIVIALFAPFTLLSPGNAQLAWALCKPFMLLGIFLLAVGIVKRGSEERAMQVPGLGILILILFVWLWPVSSDLAAGQSNLLMLLPLMGALALLQKGNRIGDILAGVLLALAISVKVTPLIFLPYLLLQRRWTAAGATVAGLGLWLIVVPGVLFGFGQNWTWLREWASIMLLPYIDHNAVVYANNQSLPSFLARLLENIPAFLTTNKTRTVTMAHYMNVTSWSSHTVGLVTRALLGVLGLAGTWWMRRKLPTFRCSEYVVQVSLLAIFMLLASERTWQHHAVTLLLPLLTAGAIYTSAAAGTAVRKVTLGALFFAAMAFPLSTDAGKIFGKFGPLEARAWGVYLIPMLGLMAALVWSARRNQYESATGPQELQRSTTAA